MMETKHASQRSHVARTARSGWVAAATLIVALLLDTLAGIPFVAAGNDGIQRGIDAYFARWDAVGRSYVEGFPEQPYPELLPDTGRSAALAGDQAQTSATLLYTDVSKFYAERMRVQARQENALAASSDAEGYPEPPFPEVLPDTGRSAALAGDQAQTSATVPYTDVSKFYAERMRVQARQENALAASSELMAANPELMTARRSYRATAGLLATNPELMVARQAYQTGALGCAVGGEDLAANPELAFARQVRSC